MSEKWQAVIVLFSDKLMHAIDNKDSDQQKQWPESDSDGTLVTLTQTMSVLSCFRFALRGPASMCPI